MCVLLRAVCWNEEDRCSLSRFPVRTNRKLLVRGSLILLDVSAVYLHFQFGLFNGIDLAHGTALGQCNAASVRQSVRTATLFTLFVVVCRIDSHTLETKSNIP